MKRTTGFTADDGTWFPTTAECKKHEQRLFMHLLIERSAKDIEAAFDRTDLVLSNAFERAGNMIAAKRRESGELKRVAKKRGDGEFSAVTKAMETQRASK